VILQQPNQTCEEDDHHGLQFGCRCQIYQMQFQLNTQYMLRTYKSRLNAIKSWKLMC